jgi:hypothetical protein
VDGGDGDAFVGGDVAGVERAVAVDSNAVGAALWGGKDCNEGAVEARNLVEDPCGEVAERRSVTGGEDGGGPPSALGEAGVPDRIDPDVDPVQSPAGESAGDRGSAEAGREELSEGDDPVLALGAPRDDCVGGGVRFSAAAIRESTITPPSLTAGAAADLHAFAT